jgi:ABC-type transport system involved in multi-copper enzyme maturation permease subunit
MTTKLPSALKSAGVIAYSTFLEAIRNRLLMVTLVFAAVLMGLSVTAASVSLGERTRLIVDVGLAAGSAIGSIIAIALSISSFGGEIRKRTAYTVLVRPIPRWGFILGKFWGLSATMALVITGMLLATAGLVLIQGEQLPIAFWGCLWLNLIEVMIVIAISLFFSTLAVPVLAATYTGGLVLAGNLAGDILEFIRQAAAKGMENAAILEYFYYLLPDLQELSLRNEAANNLDIPLSFIANGTAYGLCYSLTVLIGAMWVFTARKSL